MPHIHELYDFVVNVFIVHDNKVLLVKHPKYGGIWISAGGHVELDEDPEEALFKEVAEETGLKVEIIGTKPSVKSPETKFLYTPQFMDVHDANPPHKHIALIYFARSDSDNFVKSDEHEELRWFSKQELYGPKYQISNAVKFYSLEALKAAGKSK